MFLDFKSHPNQHYVLQSRQQLLLPRVRKSPGYLKDCIKIPSNEGKLEIHFYFSPLEGWVKRVPNRMAAYGSNRQIYLQLYYCHFIALPQLLIQSSLIPPNKKAKLLFQSSAWQGQVYNGSFSSSCRHLMAAPSAKRVRSRPTEVPHTVSL